MTDHKVEQVNEVPHAGKENANNEEDLLTFNFGYVLGKLMQASQNDNATQKRKWQTFVNSYQEGNLAIGGRQPVSGTPAWVTLEVANGGFATGGFMAGGPILPHETEYFKQFFNETPKSDEECREKLNKEFLTSQGLQYLSHLLETSQFDLKTPEEGALLSIVWLLNNNHEKRAKALLDIISPWFGKLRFYPIPTLTPRTMGAEVSVATVQSVADALALVHTPGFMLVNRQAVEKVLPLYDELLAAVLKTTAQTRAPEVVGDKIEGDLPFEVLDEPRKAEIKKVLKEIEKLPKESISRRFRCGHLGLLIKIAKRAVAGPPTPRDREVARKIIALVNKKRGLPGSPKLEELREKQKKFVARIGVVDVMSKILIQRLNPSISNVSAALRPVQKNEAQPPIVVEGQAIPESLAAKVRRAKSAPIEELCAEGLVPSAEVLAILCPTVVANVLARGISDRTLAALYGAIYKAFKDRRSLLLLNLEKQVEINEIPWFADLEKMKPKQKADKMEGEGTKSVLEDMVMLALKNWPETMMPNKFIGILYDLTFKFYTEGTLKGFPFMKELASDIFMGKFSTTFVINAHIAAKLMRGTLYEAYYDIDYEKVKNFKLNGADLDQYCGTGTYSTVTANGKAIERCMIVTTHNLALVFDRLNMKQKLQDVMPEFPSRIFNFIIRETNNLTGMDWQTRLQHLKNAAYAFRQLVFFLSFLSKEEQESFFGWAFARCDKIQDEGYKGRLLLPLKSLHATWKGEKEEHKTIFSGWVADKERHFLMPPKKA
eukprot:Phypoly_transcript_03164.p1 GENE.Phypoly_transcript_03164~~Phypoly_transcript_03164.p1  ORF type:complete len:819 (+),score=172.04 Phypoly_transcript_03164:141-2459(+)